MKVSRSRVNNLVRINGRRVDVTKVEKEILRLKDVTNCVVVVPNQGKDYPKQLIAFITAEETITYESLCSNLDLPEYMYPTAMVQMSRLPLDSEGNMDKHVLMKFSIADHKTLKDLEQDLMSITGIENAAIVYKEKAKDIEYVHLDDVLPQIKHEKEHIVSDMALENRVEDKSYTSNRSAIIDGGVLVNSDNKSSTLVDVIHEATSRFPKHGIWYVDEMGDRSFESYPKIVTEAKSILAGLKKYGLKPKDKAILQLNKSRDFIPTFWACILGGIVPVPVHVPKNLNENDNEVHTLYSIWSELDHAVILTNNESVSSLQILNRFSTYERNIVININELSDYPPEYEDYRPSPDDVTLMLYTSGSTGRPKGVTHTHGSIISWLRGAIQLYGYTSEEVSLNWMPLEHVGGIVMSHIKECFLGCPQVQVHTEYILSEPTRWLDLLSEFKATITWAPNFAYALINEEIDNKTEKRWDLTALNYIFNGAEQINANICKKFLRLLKSAGLRETAMYPVWGMSETCSGVLFSTLFTDEEHTGVDRVTSYEGVVKKVNDAQAGLEYIHLDAVIPGVCFRIVNDKQEQLNEGIIGNVQVKGATLTQGYFKNVQANEAAFTKDGWLDTGDLGYVLNGKLAITGRKKDVLIINGINYSNAEIERVIEEIEGIAVSYVAVCAIRHAQSNTDQVAVFFAVEESEALDQLAKVKEIRKQVSAKMNLAISYVIPVTKDEIPKTNIGKILRSKLVKKFKEGFYKEYIRQVDLYEKNQNTLPDYFFTKEWMTKKIQWQAADVANRKCLIIESDNGLGQFLTQRISEAGGQSIRISCGNQSANLGSEHYSLDVDSQSDYSKVMQQIVRTHGTLTDIFFIAKQQSSEESSEQSIVSTVRKRQKYGLYSMLQFIQALNEHITDRDQALRFYAVTFNSQQILDEKEVQLSDGTISGFIKSASLELPWLKCCLLDLACEEQRKMADWVLDEWRNVKLEQEVAYRYGKRYIPSLKPLSIRQEQMHNINIEQEGLYLATGGLGGIGAQVCKSLSQNFGVTFIIVGRTELPSRTEWKNILSGGQSKMRKRIEAYLDLEHFGVDFVYHSCDISDAAGLNQAVEAGENKWGKLLSGVLHLAGEGNLEHHWEFVDKHWIVNESENTFESMFQSKVYGTLALHEILKKRPEAVFIIFSSINGFFGAATFSAYSAASSFVDNFSIFRRENGFPQTYCISWSMWDNLGMSLNSPATEATLNKGFLSITTKQGIHSLLTAMCLEPKLLFVGLDRSNSHIRTYLPFEENMVVYPTVYVQSELKDISTVVADKLERMDTIEAPKIVQLSELPVDEEGNVEYNKLVTMNDSTPDKEADGELQTETEKRLSSIFKDILSVNQVKRNNSFFELGGHSLKATQLLSRIYSQFGVNLSIQMIFTHAKLHKMAEIIDGLINTNLQENIEEIPKLPKKKYYELSHAQKRIYFMKKMEPESCNYNILGCWKIKGSLDIDTLSQSLLYLVKRYQSLRTVFKTIDGEPVQEILENMEIKPNVVDLSAYASKERKNKIDQITQNKAEQIYELETGPLMNVTVLKLQDQEHMLLIGQHHIISDGWSLSLLIKEMGHIYESILAGKEPQLQELTIQETDFFAWHNQHVENKTQDKEYWLNHLAGDLSILELPLDFTRPKVRTYHGETKLLQVDNVLRNKLDQLSQKQGSTLFMTLLSSFKVLLYKLSGSNDIIVGSPIAGRNHRASENLMGMFVNTLAFRTKIDSSQSFTNYLEQVKNTTLAGYEHQDYPFDKLIEDINPERELSRTPIFQVMMGYLNMPLTLKMADLEIDEKIPNHRVAKFDLTLHVLEQQNGLSIYFEYNTDLFKPETIERWMNYYCNLLMNVVDQPSRSIKEIQLLDQKESEMILHTWNETKTNYPQEKSIVELFEEQVSLSPTEKAISCDGIEITYEDLNKKSNAIASELRKLNVTRDDVVGIMVDRSIEAIVGILGILKAGGAYLPIDPQYPDDRMNYMIETANVDIVLTRKKYCLNTQQEFRSIFNQCHLLWLDDDHMYNQTIDNMEIINEPSDLAYIIYTSGSTGQPKGVMVEHKNIVRLVKNTKFISFDQGDRILQTGALTFDASTFEIWGSLLNGLTLYIVDENTILDAEMLGESIAANKITTMWLSSPLFNQLTQYNPKMFRKLKYLLVGGDALSPKHINEVRQACPDVKMINGYGPTENTTFSTTFLIDQIFTDTIPIGHPISNSTVYIYDQDGQLCPLGVPGELYVGGDGVARGYVNNPDLTSEKFVAHPLHSEEKVYRTGDIVKWRDDGAIQYVGRKDNQVKIRGYRIECEEIVKVLLTSEKVKECTVTVATDEHGHKSLIAYVVTHVEINSRTLKSHLQKSLPDYMIPERYVFLGRIPLLNNGKIDYRALPEHQVHSLEEEFVLPRNEIEECIVSLYKEILGLEQLSVKDSFFYLGGDSILSIKLVSKLKEKGYSVDPKMIFLSPTPEELADVLKESALTDISKSRSYDEYLIKLNKGTEEESGMILAPPAGGTIMGYIPLAKELDIPVSGLQSPGLFEDEEPQFLSYEELVQFFIKSISETFRPTIDYLGGHSVGGHIAFGMCQELIRQGRPPKGLMIFDTTPSLQIIEGEDELDESEIKTLLLVLGMGNMVGIGHEELKGMSFDEAKNIILKEANKDQRIKEFMSEDYLDKYLKLQFHNVMMSRVLELEETPIDIPIIVFKTEEHPGDIIERFDAWKQYTTQEPIYISVPGNHVTMMREPHVSSLAKKIKEIAYDIKVSIG